MTWEEKFAALNAIAEARLKMRRPGDWYVSQSVEIKDRSILKGEYGNGTTPEAAIEDHWQRLTNLKPHEYLVTNAGQSTRAAHRWTGFMWSYVNEDLAA